MDAVMNDLVLCDVIVTDAGDSALAWATGRRFAIPEPIVQRWQDAGAVTGERVVLGPATRVLPEEADALRLAAAYTETPPLSSRLPFSYHYVPSLVRSMLARCLGGRLRRREHRWARFPRWPLDLSADLLADLAGQASPFAGAPTPVVLTHDLDSQEGLDNVCPLFIDREERIGASSTSFIVPNGWLMNPGPLRELQAHGHELGIHGYDHSNRTSFVTPEERDQRLREGRRLAGLYRMIGYRAPSLLRSRALLEALPRYYTYDSSIPTSGGPFPVPNNGCASARPFMLGSLVELPLSLPRDGSLLFLGYSAADMAALWIELAQQIARSGGVVVLLTHCEARFSGNQRMLAAYDRFLDFIASTPQFVWRTAQEVVEQYQRTAVIADGCAA